MESGSHGVFKTAHPVTVLKDMEHRIESIAAWRRRLYVGTASGTLLVYEQRNQTYLLIDTVKKFARSKGEVRKLRAVPEWGVLLSVSDGYLTVHDLDTLQSRAQLMKTRYCSEFCTSVDASIMCVAAKRKLLMFLWDGADFNEYKEYQLPDQARSLIWAVDSVCIGFRREYDLLDTETGLISKEIFETGRSADGPVAAVLEGNKEGAGGSGSNAVGLLGEGGRQTPSRPTDGEMLLANDARGIFVGFDGKPTREAGQSVEWSSNPVAVCHVRPFIVTLLAGCVEVHSATTTTLSQRVAVANAKFIVHNGEGSVLVGTTSSIDLLSMAPLTAQVDALADNKLFDEALSLCACRDDSNGGVSGVGEYGGCEGGTGIRSGSSSSSSSSGLLRIDESQIRSVHSKFAYHLFSQLQFDAALKQFHRAGTDVRRVLGLFPELLPHGTPVDEFEYPVPVPRLEADSLQQALRALIPFLNDFRDREALRRRAEKEDREREREKKLAAADADTATEAVAVAGGSAGGEATDAAAAKNMEAESAAAGQGSTAAASASPDKQVNVTIGLADTVLLKAYLHTEPEAVVHFLRGSNECWVAECETLLKAAGKWEELVELYRSKAMHRKALSLLAKLGQAERSEKGKSANGGADGGGGGDASSITGKSGSSNHQTELQKYMQQMVVYMASLGQSYSALLFEFSRWVLAEDPALGLKIFTLNPAGVPPLDPYRVLSHLKACSLASLKEEPKPLWQQHALAVDFLEYLINEHDPPSTDAAFHNELVYLYVEAILALTADKAGEKKKKKKMGTGGSSKENSKSRPTLASEEEGPLREYRGRLLRFLEHSQFYSPEKILSKFPSSRLLEERAILLSRVGKHDRALHIYIHKLNAKDLAERYCEKFFINHEQKNPNSGGKSDVYLSLLRAYLRRPPGSKGSKGKGPGGSSGDAGGIKDALALLTKHYKRIDPNRALELLPKTATIGQVERYLRAVLRNNSSRHRTNQVVVNLLKLENLQVLQNLLQMQNNAVKIAPSRVCPVCNRRVGDRIFACYPNGIVVHFACSKDRFECPVTGERFDDKARCE